MELNWTQSALKRIRNVTSRLSGKKSRKRIQLAGSAASALGIFVAIWVAAQGQVTVDRSSRASLQQSEDSQLSTAITAIGSDNTAEEIAGLLLLARNTSSRFTLMGDTKESPGDVFDDYTTALHPRPSRSPSPAAFFPGDAAKLLAPAPRQPVPGLPMGSW